MNQHPLPQNITSYQFHLIGSMTLKQFLLLGGGIVIAWLSWSYIDTPIFKWPLSAFAAISGVAFAFLPYQDRSLDLWLTAFIKTIYNPTQFIWKKRPQTPDFLSSHVKKSLPEPTPLATQKTTSRPLNTYLESLPVGPSDSQIDTQNQIALSQIDQLFSEIKIPTPQNPKFHQTTITPIQSVKVKVRKLKSPPPQFSQESLPSPALLSPAPLQQSLPSPKKPSAAGATPIPTTQAPLPTKASFAGAIVNPHLPFPLASTIPNLIIGMTLDEKRNILEGAIIEVRNSLGHPVRALKSNKLGQFFTATPLPNDTYEIHAEKESHIFAPIKLSLKGNIIQPIEITASSSPTQPSN